MFFDFKLLADLKAYQKKVDDGTATAEEAQTLVPRMLPLLERIDLAIVPDSALADFADYFAKGLKLTGGDTPVVNITTKYVSEMARRLKAKASC